MKKETFRHPWCESPAVVTAEVTGVQWTHWLQNQAWDYIRFLRWFIIPLEGDIRRWAPRMEPNWVWGKKVVLENIPHPIPPPLLAGTVYGSMLSCCLRQILTPPCEFCSWNRDFFDQVTFFQSSFVHFLLRLCELSPHLSSQPFLSWPLKSTSIYLPTTSAHSIITCFLTIYYKRKKGCAWKSQQICSFWTSQMSLFLLFPILMLRICWILVKTTCYSCLNDFQPCFLADELFVLIRNWIDNKVNDWVYIFD